MKQLLAFVLLLISGFALVFWLASDAPTSVAPQLGGAADGKPRSTPQQPGGVAVQQGPLGATFSQTGPLNITRWRAVPETAGRERKEEVFVLQAADSRPLGEGRQQLDGVTVKLFDGPAHAATLRAQQALVALQPDASGKPSVDEGKDIDLRGVIVDAEPGSRLRGFHLELGAARVRVEDGAITLVAPDDEPVLARLADDRPLTLRGFGLRASLPSDAKGRLLRADVVVPREPVAELEGTTVRSRGALRFVDDAEQGAAELTLHDAVELTSDRAGFAAPGGAAAAGPGRLTVRGDHFVGWLLRHEDGQRQQMTWRRLELTGAPATVTLPGGRLTTPRLTAHPNAYGDLAWLTAHGGESRIEQTEARRGRAVDDTLVGVSEKRVHFAEPRALASAHLRSFGWPRWTMRPLEQLQAVVVEGRATVQDKTSLCTATAGARLYRRDGSAAGFVRGLGQSRVERRGVGADSRDLVATSSDGFTLTVRDGVQRAQIGPAAPGGFDVPGPWTKNAFTLRHGDAEAAGNGVATIEQRGDDVVVEAGAPDASITATMPKEGLALRRVARLFARLHGNRPVVVDAAGWPVDIVIARGDDRIAARAPRLLQIGPASLRLLPADPQTPFYWTGLPAADRTPTLRRAMTNKDGAVQDLDVRGPSIDVHHTGGRSALVDAIAVGFDLPVVHARMQQRAGQEATTLACTAARLRLLPFLAPTVFRERLLGDDADGALGRALFRGVGSPWLVVDAVRDFQLDDPRQGHVEGLGTRLIVSQGGRAAMFLGDAFNGVPAQVTRAHDGRTTTLRGARVRVVDAAAIELDAFGAFPGREQFLAPTLTLHEAERTGLLAHMQAVCQGDIAVRGDEVGFGGPVAARGLLPDGALDPRGMSLDARTLRLLRSAETGEIVRADAGDVTLDWTEARARCASLDIDLRWSRIVAADPRDAVVTMRDGRELRSPRIEVNYATQSARMTSGRMAQRADGEAPR